MHRDSRVIHNTASLPLRVVLEPWGEELQLAPGATLRIVGCGESAGAWELERQEHTVILCGWPTSTFEVFEDDVLRCSSPVPVPGVPKGHTVASFLQGVFGGGPGARG